MTQAGLRPGETVLVHAAGSGVGLAAVQIARALGARVFGTARGAEKLAAAREAGMEAGVSPGPPGWVAGSVQEWTGGRGIDVALDSWGDYVLEPSPRWRTGAGDLIGMRRHREPLDLRRCFAAPYGARTCCERRWMAHRRHVRLRPRGHAVLAGALRRSDARFPLRDSRRRTRSWRARYDRESRAGGLAPRQSIKRRAVPL